MDLYTKRYSPRLKDWWHSKSMISRNTVLRRYPWSWTLMSKELKNYSQLSTSWVWHDEDYRRHFNSPLSSGRKKKPCVCPQTGCPFKNKVCTICQYKVLHIKRNQVFWKRRAREKKEDIFCLRDENARTWKKEAKSENNLNSHTRRNGAKHEKLGFRHPLLYLPQDSRRYIYFQR